MPATLNPWALPAATAGLLLVMVVTVALPLATYTTVLALFGLAHVLAELRYLDFRFGGRVGAGLLGLLAAPLTVAVGARLAGLSGWIPAPVAVGLEVAAGGVLVALAARCFQRVRWPGLCCASALLVAAVVAPFATLLTLAVTHNLTPLAFVAERLDHRQRGPVLALLAIPFVALPMLIATGLPFAWMAQLGLVDPDASPFAAAGSLEVNLGAYVPAASIDQAWALHAFTASVFAQCMHYGAVILVLPRLIDRRDVPVLRWPGAARFAAWLAVVAGALALGFAADYGLARRVYALAALVHAWIELPLMLLVLDRLVLAPGQARSSP